MVRNRFVPLELFALVLASVSAHAAEKDNKIPGEIRVILEKAAQIELMSIYPDDIPANPNEGFHGWKVLG